MGARANPRFEDALAFAARAHAAVNQARKGSDFPYVVHPIRVAQILDRVGAEDDVVVAGFLHDTIEDTLVTAAELTAVFGARVAALVEAASEPDKTLPWKARKQHTLDHLEHETDPGILALIAADKLDNARSIAVDIRERGKDAAWARFNAPPSEQRWYYEGIARILTAKDPESPLVQALDREVKSLAW
jgi:(p)ppGpp synthase/HD superfamily hydrolase